MRIGTEPLALHEHKDRCADYWDEVEWHVDEVTNDVAGSEALKRLRHGLAKSIDRVRAG